MLGPGKCTIGEHRGQYKTPIPSGGGRNEAPGLPQSRYALAQVSFVMSLHDIIVTDDRRTIKSVA